MIRDSIIVRRVLTDDPRFWSELDKLARSCEVVVDRPAGQPHAQFPELIYPFDYGFLRATSGGDGAELDVWLGATAERTVTAVACTIDPYNRDGELKVFLGCTGGELAIISQFLRVEAELPHLLIRRPSAPEDP